MSKVVKKTLEGGIINTKLYRNGELWWESYKLNGKKHREDGPAFINYHSDGSIYWEEYWLNNKAYHKKEYKAWLLNKEADEIIQTMLEEK